MRITRIKNIYIEVDGGSVELMIVNGSKALRSEILDKSDVLFLLKEVMDACTALLPRISAWYHADAVEASQKADEYLAQYEKTKDETLKKRADNLSAIAKRGFEIVNLAEQLLAKLDEAKVMLKELLSMI